MLSNVTIQNFGCFDDYSYEVNFSKFSMLIGLNNSGKSTIFKGLNLVRNIPYEKGVKWNTPYYSLNSFQDAVYGHDDSRTISVSTKYTLNSDNYESKFSFQGDAYVENEFQKNGSTAGQLISDSHKDIAKTVWYFAPNRSIIQYRTPIGEVDDLIQSLKPSGENIINYLLQRYTDRDPKWNEAEGWLHKIDEQMSILKTPVVGSTVSAITTRNDQQNQFDINLNLQGSGIQNAATIISALFFSPENSTIIIEEPENFLQHNSVEILFDLFNYITQNTSKQVIVSTHSFDMMVDLVNDIGNGLDRGSDHIKADESTFKMIGFNMELGKNKIKEIDATKLSIAGLWNEINAVLKST